MPITLGDKDKDTLGDLLRQQSGEPGYDPQRWQDEANGQAKNRVLRHGSGNDAVEVIEAQPPVSRLLEIRTGTGPELLAYVESHGSADPFLLAHREEILKESDIIYVAEQKEGQRAALEALNAAITRTCQRYGEPLTHPAPLPAPLQQHDAAKIQREDVKRLEAEQSRVKNPPRNWATDSRSMDNASLRSMPVAKAKVRR